MINPDFSTQKHDVTESYGKFVFTPLPNGFGHSMGNAFRRVLLSAIEGAAVTHININDVVHPFSTLEGVKESALDIILNVKELNFKTKGKGPYTMKLSKKGKGTITAADFEGGDVEVVNKDQHIAELTSGKAKLDITLTIEEGLGFSASEEKEKPAFGTLAVDSVFSPVTQVLYKVEDERVGRKTNYDKLTLEVWTNGSVSPEDAVSQSADVLSNFFSFVMSEEGRKAAEKKKTRAAAQQVITQDEKVNEIIIDELDLPTRVVNALLREKIETVGDLIEEGPDSLMNLKGVGKKSLTLIEKELEKFGVELEE